MEPERTPDAMMTHTIKGTTYVVASFFSQNSNETAADKMARLIEREAAMKDISQKNLLL
mgnify:FL=1